MAMGAQVFTASDARAMDFPDLDLSVLDTLDALDLPPLDLDAIDRPAPPVHIERRAASGDVWEAGRHRLYCTDHRASEVRADIAAWGPTDIVFDPPFQWSAVYDWLPPAGPNALLVFSDAYRVVEAAMAATARGWRFRWQLVWDGLSSWYAEGRPLVRHKTALVFGEFDWDFKAATYLDRQFNEKHLSTVYTLANNGVENDHPHAKPLAWVRAMLAGVGATRVWDPCAGSGTALLASEALGIESRGADLDPYAVDVALHRLERAGLEVRRVGSVEARGAPRQPTDTRYQRSRYYRSAAWKRLRRAVLDRDRETCQKCGAQPGRAQLQVDHILAREEGGPDLPDNLETLCLTCHGRKTLG